MTADFQIKALDPAAEKEAKPCSAIEAGKLHGTWLIADTTPGYPCRVSLQDANVGERVLLFPYIHHDVKSPYRSAGPIYVRQHAILAKPDVNHIPVMLKVRPQSVRAYDQAGFMLAAEVVSGAGLEAAIRHHLSDPAVHYLHLHNAGPGCFNCKVVRA